MTVIKLLLFLFYGVYHVVGVLYLPELFQKSPEEYFQAYYASGEEAGESLILTPLIEANKLDEAKTKAKVEHQSFFNVASYSGYFTVDKTYNSNLFFWFFPAEENYEHAPVMLWLQGGPGESSFTGLFTENGPFKIVNDSAIELREERWSKNISMLYIDNPVGAGYSFTDAGGHCKNQSIIGEHLYTALQQFFKIFPEIAQNEFFIAAESYGGKYGPALGHTIHERNKVSNSKINLKGLALDSGYSDPEHMINYGEYLYQIGMIDENTKATIEGHQADTLKNVKKGEYQEAVKSYSQLLMTFVKASGLQSLYNYLNVVDPVGKLSEHYTKFVTTQEIRKAIHVGSAVFSKQDEYAYTNLTEDFMKGVAPWVEELLNDYRLITYNGQLDIIVAYPLTENYLKNLNFSSASEYKNAERKQWYVNGELAGYVKTAGHLTEVLVRKGGHVIVHDQPTFCYDLINKFVKNQSIA